MSVQPVPPSTGPTTAGQLAARATQNDQFLAAWLDDHEGRVAALESGGGTSGSLIVRTTSLTTIPAGTTEGELVGYRNSHTGPITIAGETLQSGDWGVWGWFGGAWVLLNTAATAPIVPDETAPTAPTLSVAANATTLDATYSGGTDNVAVTQYRVRIGGGAWVVKPSAGTHQFAGLSPTTSYTVDAQAGDAAGNWSPSASWTGSTAAVPDTTPPTAGTLAASAISDTTFTLTVTGAGDNVGLHAQPYDFSTDNGATWSGYQSSNIRNVTGRTGSTSYQARHRVRDAAGNVTLGTAITVTTEAPGYTPPQYAETFTRPDGTNINGTTTETGGTSFVTNSPSWASEVGLSSSTSMTVQSGRLTGGGAAMTEPRASTAVDHRYSLDYDVSAGTTAQVRLSLNAGPPDYYIIFGDGRLVQNSLGAGSVATGLPTTGTVEVTRTGTSVVVKVNGATVHTGTAATITSPLRTRIGFGIGGTAGATVDNFKAWVS